MIWVNSFRQMRWLLLVFMMMSCVFSVDAEIVEADGYGKTEREAEYDAVVQAVRRVTGVNITETEVWRTSEAQLVKTTNSEFRNQQDFVDKLNKENYFGSKGRVKGWKIESMDFIESHRRFKAHLSVDVATFHAPDGMPNDQRRIVILPFETKNDSFKAATKRFELKEMSHKLAEKLNDYITQTRKFSVLDRRYDKAVNNELMRIEGKDASPDDLSKLGNKLATDYMIVGDLRIMDKRNGLDSIDEEQGDYEMLIVHYRIILCATTQVRWSDTISVPASVAVGKTEEECVERLLDEGAKRLHLAVFENIYPVKLADVIRDDLKNTRFVLNRGGRSMKVGDIFSLLELGREILDPDSGEVLERQEKLLGKIRIVEVRNKVSYAILEVGSHIPSINTRDFSNFVVRRVGQAAHEVQAVEKKPKVSPSALTNEKSMPLKNPKDSSATVSGRRLTDLRREQYSEIEKTLYKMRTGNFSAKKLSALWKMRKDAPNAEIKILVEKIVGAGLVSMEDYKAYNQIRKNIDGARALESKMKESCSVCSGTGESPVTCRDCGGGGKCKNCNGVGYRTYTPSGSFTSVRVACHMCSREDLDGKKASSGQCVKCEGTGKVNGKCRKCSGSGKAASASVAEKLVLSLIQNALDEFAISRGEKDRNSVKNDDENSSKSLEDNSSGEDADEVSTRGGERQRRSKRTRRNAFLGADNSDKADDSAD